MKKIFYKKKTGRIMLQKRPKTQQHWINLYRKERAYRNSKTKDCWTGYKKTNL